MKLGQGAKLQGTGLGSGFWDETPKAQATSKAKDTTEWKGEGEGVCEPQTSAKGPTFRANELHLNTTQIFYFFKWAKDFQQAFLQS